MPKYQIEVKSVPDQMIGCIRDLAKNYQSVGPLYEELMVELDKHNLEIAGPAFGIFYDEEYTDHDVDVEVALPVKADSEMDGGRFKVRILDGHKTMASLTRVGPWDDFSGAYQSLMEWLQSEGWRIIGPNREIYLKGPESGAPAAEYVVEIQFPVVKA